MTGFVVHSRVSYISEFSIFINRIISYFLFYLSIQQYGLILIECQIILNHLQQSFTAAFCFFIHVFCLVCCSGGISLGGAGDTGTGSKVERTGNGWRSRKLRTQCLVAPVWLCVPPMNYASGKHRIDCTGLRWWPAQSGTVCRVLMSHVPSKSIRDLQRGKTPREPATFDLPLCF